MKVLAISHACVVDEYRKKFELMADNKNVELTLVIPRFSNEASQVVKAAISSNNNCSCVLASTLLTSKLYLHFYPFLPFQFYNNSYDILYVEEEPWSMVATEIILCNSLKKKKLPAVFFTWQNLLDPWKHSSTRKFLYGNMENLALKYFVGAIAGNMEAFHRLRKKLFPGPIKIIPQFGVDPNVFKPLKIHNELCKSNNDPPVIGFVGRLIPEKGIFVLLDAFRKMQTKSSLLIIGNGSAATKFKQYLRTFKLHEKVNWIQSVKPTQMPYYFNRMNVLVLPSMESHGWKEQFGRVLVEAMACQTPVVGSSSGEIPNVIDNAGVTFQECNSDELAQKLDLILNDYEMMKEYGELGRQRVLEHFTQEKIANKTLESLKEIMETRN